MPYDWRLLDTALIIFNNWPGIPNGGPGEKTSQRAVPLPRPKTDEESPMLNKKTLSLALTAALFALPMVSLAQDGAEEAAAEEESSIYSWNAAIATDYMFRGVSQTDGEAALQLGADLNFDNGFYVGVWGSNVDFGEGSPDVELDTYIGWNHDLTERLNLDLMVNRYNYIGEADDYGAADYNEFIGALTLDEAYTFTLGYTNDVYALGETGMYFGLGGSWELPHAIGLDVAVGRSTFDEATGYEDYSDFSISFNKDFGPVNAAIGYYGTDADGDVNFGDAADNRFMLTLSIGG